MKLTNKLASVAVASALSIPAMMVATPAQAEVTGNVGVFSKYVLRGIFEENNNTAVQGGIDYAHDNGFYLGWWASNLSYTYNSPSNPTAYTSNGFENDFYGGYGGSAGNFNYNVGLIQYYYLSVDDSDLTELFLSAGYGPVNLNAQYLLNDGWWGNSGDVYWTVDYSTDLPSDFSFGAVLGFYTYDDDDAGNSKKGWTKTTQTSAFRHLDLTLSHPIGNSGADMNITYIVAGEDREGTNYDDTMVLSVTYDFDI